MFVMVVMQIWIAMENVLVVQNLIVMGSVVDQYSNQIMVIAVILTAVAISRYVATQALTSDLANPSEATMQTLLTGQTFALFIIVVAAAEIALGLAIVIAFYRSKETIDISQANSMSE